MKSNHLAVASLLLVGALAAPLRSANAVSAGIHDTDGDGTLSVLIIYDDTGPFAELGPIYAQMLTNLLGHFPEVEAWSTPTTEYAAGELLANEVSFYIGATYQQPLPPEFVNDFWLTDRPLVWMGYNLWQIGWTDWNLFIGEYGFQHWYIAGNEGQGEQTEFFRYVDYKGQTLPKFAWWDGDTSTFINDPMMNILYVADPGAMDVVATATHSATGETVPYIVHAGNLWQIGDIPFTLIHERDRYLAFADLLHDLVGIDHEPTQTALFRLEDVHPYTAPADIRKVTDVLREGIARPWSMGIIPQYADPLGYYNDGTPQYLGMNDPGAGTWRRQVNRARRLGADVVLHGYTHQYSDVPNPYNGVSGDDYEFWNATTDGPVAEDSFAWFADRLDAANAMLAVRGWAPFAWEVPHYRASVADLLYGTSWYETVYHRAVYYPYEIQLWGQVITWNQVANDPQLQIDWAAANVALAGDRWGGQFFPYVIERDSYGQRILPETLGNLEPPEFALAPQHVRVADDLIANAEANLVNRCGYASFFYHGYLMEFPEIQGAGGKAALRDLISRIEALGYTFKAASDL